MKYKSCHWVNRGIEFKISYLRLCCYGYLQSRDKEYEITIKRNYHGEKIDWNEIFAIKDKLKEQHKRGEYLDSCKNCIYLEEKAWDDENYINHFLFNHWTRCNCNCKYCFTMENKKAYNNFKEYPIYPVIKDMFEKGVIKKMDESCIIFGGGEPTILKDFDKLIDLFIKKGSKNIRINSSGIKYSKAIEKGLKLGVLSLVISPDSGTKEMYEEIKQVKAYDKVWKNIRKYARAQLPDKNNLLKVKYIIWPGVNDNKEEIDKWFDKVIENDVKAISFSVEQAWYFKNQHNYPDSIYETISYMENKAKELDLDLEIYCEAIAVIREHEEKLAKQKQIEKQ